jgi:UDP-N-acetylglucosamine--N-acetylmuramyl-(pentapeptide) pyrophosphoryl-undecaprenol N-acetylglucosamine transferase
VYPALAVLRALESIIESKDENFRYELTTLWIGGEGGMEADLVKREGIRFESIPAAGVHGIGLGALPGNLLKLVRGFLKSNRVLNRFKPDMLFFTGGYVAVPLAIAARLNYNFRNRPKSLLYVPDIEPGLALKSLSIFADHIAITVMDSKKYFSRQNNMTVTGYPVRSDLKKWSVEKSRKAFTLRDDMPILLVIGGSKGARSINISVSNLLSDLLSEMQIIHIVGTLDWQLVENARSNLSPELMARYRPFPYLHENMGAAYTIADVVLSRAGASSLGEYPLFGLPAILVPYPYAWRYQYVNAQHLVDQGAAVIVEDAAINEELFSTLRLLMTDPERRQSMSEAMSRLAHPNAAYEIAELLADLNISQSHKDIANG